MPVISTGKYLRRESVSPEGQTHQVIRCVEEEINSADGGSELKWILYMSDLKPLIMNATNIRRCISALGGSQTDSWVGQSLVLYDDAEVEFGGKVVGGVRVRAVPKAKAKSKDPIDKDAVPF
tara:strand:- start:660 stop:1025 length:366 start_codon:yes stop_codon:yes gene_type:complete